MQQVFKVGEVAKEAGVKVQTLHLYECTGLLSESQALGRELPAVFA